MAADKRYRILVSAVLGLVFNLLFALYYGILGVLSASLIFLASAVYYVLLSAMRFVAVIHRREGDARGEGAAIRAVGVMLILLGAIFHIMVLVSMKYGTAAVRGTIPMITIATFTFTKITAAILSAVRHRRGDTRFVQMVNAIRYSEVAVSLLTMQQSMLVSFGDGEDTAALVLNALLGAGVCVFILFLGILTYKNGHKKP